MNEVFINYRTGDGEEAAALLDAVLSARFGKKRIFRASKSIPPGQPFSQALLDGVRDCSVLLAVMGPGWSRDSRLRLPDDWVRREILTALEAEIQVFPVLKGRKTDRLDAADLPAELAKLAKVQSLRLDLRGNGADVIHIGDEIAAAVPALKKAEARRVRRRRTEEPSRTVIRSNHGQLHTGKGNNYQGTRHFSAEHITNIEGDSGDITHRSRRDDR